MRREIVAVIGVGALLAMSPAALAQDPCATVTSQGASLSGFAGVKAEPALGGNAFSLVKKEQLLFSGIGKGGVYTLSLNRDAGIGPGDEDRVRTIAKQVVEGR